MTSPVAARVGRGPRSKLASAGLASGALLVFAVLIGLGTWQVHRLGWKLALIARVDARIHAAPVDAPPAGAALVPERDEYRRVRVTGSFLVGRDTLVQALTAYGSGFWVLAPLRRTDDGTVVLVNRGFVPSGKRDPADWAPPRSATVVGLLRLSEPKGTLLRANDPAADRWYSRDVAAIAQARGLTDPAPYFIDAEAGPAGTLPIGGLTVTTFPNNHLVYAVTWYALAALLLGASLWVARDEWRQRSKPAG